MENKPRIVDELIQGDENVRSNFGIEVISAKDGSCEVTMVVSEQWVNGAGFTHGSVAYALMDSACAYACGSLEVLGLTTNGNVTYVRATKAGARIRGRAKVVSQSRRVISFSTELVDEQDNLLAHGSFVFQAVEKR
jgi:acyl-CoA thioesterase